MAESDRSRSPPSQRNRSDARGPLPNGPLPGFPRWCGPMGAAVRHLNNMPRPQLNTPWMMQQSGPYAFGPRGMNTSTSPQWPSQPFPPVPPGTPLATLPYPRPPGISTSHYPSTPLCSPTQPCSPGTPSISPSQPRSAASPHGDIHSPSRVNEGFDLNASWQADKDHFDNQKANGLTFPRTIRQSAFTQRLDIEGCDTLTLPVAALLYQQANNNWLRKLAHGREVYLIPTGDIRSCGIHDGVADSASRKRHRFGQSISNYRARQDGKVLDKTANTKYAAQQIIQGWLPARTTDPESQQEITQLRNQLAQLKQQLGTSPAEPSASTGPSPTGPNPAGTAIGRALHGQPVNPPSSTPPAFDPSCLLSVPTTTNQCLLGHTPSTLAIRAYAKWLKELPISDSKRTVLNTNIEKMEKWWERQPSGAVDTVERVAVMMGIPVSLLGKNYDVLNLLRAMTAAISMTNLKAPQLRRKLNPICKPFIR